MAYALAKTDYDRQMTPAKRVDLALQVRLAPNDTLHNAPRLHAQ